MEFVSTALVKEFTEAFNSPAEPLLVRSPGRVNIIGEHTDYNEGFVMPAAIDKAVYAAISLRDDEEIHLVAKDMGESFRGHIHKLEPAGHGAWPNYILGSAAQFSKRAIPLRGFNLMLTSTLPVGAGLSSSAAVECATVFGLNELLQTGLSRIEMVHMAQQAEHEFAGVMCGIMDQFASMMGKKDHVIQLDCRNLEYTYLPFKLEGIKVVLLNTNVKHSLASSAYNTRRKECETAVEIVSRHVPGVHSLRDIRPEQIEQYVRPENDTAATRARFVTEEIARLQAAAADLAANDISSLGQKMYATHEGLSKLYEVSCRELDWLADQVRSDKSVIGARMMGGGFGGCTINLVREEAVEGLISRLSQSYEAGNGLPLSGYVTSIENGTEIIHAL